MNCFSYHCQMQLIKTNIKQRGEKLVQKPDPAGVKEKERLS